MTTFLWYDLETSGLSPWEHRIVQFACQRTDAGLEPLGPPESFLCRLPPDVLPDVEATLVTGVLPAHLERRGLPEPELAARVSERLGPPRTCGAGYNNVRFDDEFLRLLLYRNFHDPYEREWRDGNSRYDLLTLVRLARALRPEGTEWPVLEGRPSLRLEHLAAANGLTHDAAHEAGSDVAATVALARHLRAAQPRLWEWSLRLRDKRFSAGLLAPLGAPALLVSGRIAAERHGLSVVLALGSRPGRGNEVVVADLGQDVRRLDADVDHLREALFRPGSAEPGASGERPGLRTVHLNRVPGLAPMKVLRDGDRARLGLDLDAIAANAEWLRRRPELCGRLLEVFSAPPERDLDVEAALYEGFLPDADRDRLPAFRAAPVQQALTDPCWRFRDERLNLLRFRRMARFHPELLGAGDARAWKALVARRLREGHGAIPPLGVWEADLRRRLEGAGGRERDLLEGLLDHGRALRRAWLDEEPVPG